MQTHTRATRVVVCTRAGAPYNKSFCSRASVIVRRMPLNLEAVQGLVVVMAVVALLGAGVLLGQRAVRRIRWTRPVRLLADPIPGHWPGLVQQIVPVTTALSERDFERLLKLVQVFLHRKNIEGAGGLELTDEIRLSIAAQACLLVLWMEVGLFPGLKTVIVYPDTMVPKYVDPHRGTRDVVADEPIPILGQSWGSGVVILSWASARQAAADPRDGRNVVLHEFAHQLDQEDGAADGVPVGLPLSAVKPWAEMLQSGLQELRRSDVRGVSTVLDRYGATNEAEFFAVASETFFEKGRQLREKIPELYALLVEIYGVDPAEGFRDARPE